MKSDRYEPHSLCTSGSTAQGGGSAARAVLLLSVELQLEPAVEDKGTMVVPPRVVLPLATPALLPLEGQSYLESKKISGTSCGRGTTVVPRSGTTTPHERVLPLSCFMPTKSAIVGW